MIKSGTCGPPAPWLGGGILPDKSIDRGDEITLIDHHLIAGNNR